MDLPRVRWTNGDGNRHAAPVLNNHRPVKL